MTLLKTKISKFLNNPQLIALIFLFGISFSFAQNKQKVDGVAAVVGDFIVLDSDIDLMYIELQSQGVDTKNITRCELLGNQLEEKLFCSSSHTR